MLTHVHNAFQLDKEDESLAKWKASLGIGAAGGAGDPSAPPKVRRCAPCSTRPTLTPTQCEVLKLALVSESRASPLEIDLKGNLEEIKKNPITIKEGAEYNVEITFQVSNQVRAIVTSVRVVLALTVQSAGHHGPQVHPRRQACRYEGRQT